MIGVFTHFPRLLHLSFTFFLVAIVRCGKTLVIHDNRVRRRNIKTLLFVCFSNRIILGDVEEISIANLKALNNPSGICGHVFKPGEATYTCK